MSFQGELTDFSDGYLSGWVCDATRLQERVVVEIHGDDYPLALIHAHFWMPQSQTIGDGCYGFRVTLPASKLRGVSRLRARVANSEFWLNGTIYLNRTQTRPTSTLLGSVANTRGLKLTGWAWNSARPDHAVRLSVFVDDKLIGEIHADRRRADLIEMGLGNGRHGFSYTLPFAYADGDSHEVRVLNEQGQNLPGSPLTVAAAPVLLEQLVEADTLLPPDQRRLLAKQFLNYRDYLPMSVDFSAYPDWAACYQPEAIRTPIDCQQDLLIVVFGDGDLQKTLDSLSAQSWQGFEVLAQGQGNSTDSRLTVVDSRAWPEAIRHKLSQHDGLLSFIEAGDTLPESALARIGSVFADPAVRIAYSDCLLHRQPPTIEPWFKPDWDLNLFLSQDLLQHLFAVRSGLLPLDSVWLDHPECWPWLAVRALPDRERTASAIKHLPEVLYHRHQASLSPALDEAVAECLPAIAPGSRIETRIAENAFRVMRWRQPEIWPTVSLIIPTRDHRILLEKCIESLKKTDYPYLEIIVVDNDSQDKATLKYLSQLKKAGIRIIPYPHRFNYSAINNHAVTLATAEIIGLINDDIEAIHADWLKNMVTQLLRPDIGAVGAKLLWPNGMVQHGGVLLGLHGLAGHIGNLWDESDLGYFGYNQLIREVSAVTAACLICRKSDYLALGGLDAQAFPVAFNDVDFCLRLGESGKKIVWTPEARLWHAESASRGRDDTPEKRARLEKEKSALRGRWANRLFFDPYYNNNLNLDRYSHDGLAFPPRTRRHR